MAIFARNLVLVALLFSGIISAVQLGGRTLSQAQHPSPMPLHSLMLQFAPLQKPLAGTSRAGYYTDKNLDMPLAIAQFEQAQYILSPTVLELNNISLPVVIFDCTSPAVAMAKIKDAGFVPVAATPSGVILGANPNNLPRGRP